MKLYTGDSHDLNEQARHPAADSRVVLESQAQALRDRLREMGPENTPQRIETELELARTLLELGLREQAWETARQTFDSAIAGADWEKAVQSCETLFLSEQPLSLAALGQGVWLAVTFPIDAGVSIEMLRQIVEETPADADGAAVAAVVAHYLADTRSEGRERENLMFYTAQMLSSVARRHSDVQTQEAFDLWMRRLELDQPEKFLVRLRNVVDVLVQDDWWIDRAAIQSELPVN